jgi:hypothetical protein
VARARHRTAGIAPCSPTGCVPAGRRQTPASPCRAEPRCCRAGRRGGLASQCQQLGQASGVLLVLGHHHADWMGHEGTPPGPASGRARLPPLPCDPAARSGSAAAASPDRAEHPDAPRGQASTFVARPISSGNCRR